jgi:hypothetical protein
MFKPLKYTNIENEKRLKKGKTPSKKYEKLKHVLSLKTDCFLNPYFIGLEHLRKKD